VGKIRIKPITEEAIREATEKGAEIASSPTAITDVKVRKLDGESTLRFAFRSGQVVAIPVRLVDELEGATEAQIRHVNVSPMRDAIAFPDIDVHIYVPGLLTDVLGALIRAEIGRRAGAKSTPKKAAAVRENGKRGGRPKKRALAHA
jgi:hypothetical protein